VLHAIIAGLMKLLMRRGVPAEEQEGSGCWLVDSEADPELARSLGPLQAAACTYRIAFGPRAGQKVFARQGAMPREQASLTRTLCAEEQGFSLHAALRCDAHQRSQLQQLCRYITRAVTFAEIRTGQVVLRLKTLARRHLDNAGQEREIRREAYNTLLVGPDGKTNRLRPPSENGKVGTGGTATSATRLSATIPTRIRQPFHDLEIQCPEKLNRLHRRQPISLSRREVSAPAH